MAPPGSPSRRSGGRGPPPSQLGPLQDEEDGPLSPASRRNATKTPKEVRDWRKQALQMASHPVTPAQTRLRSKCDALGPRPSSSASAQKRRGGPPAKRPGSSQGPARPLAAPEVQRPSSSSATVRGYSWHRAERRQPPQVLLTAGGEAQDLQSAEEVIGPLALRQGPEPGRLCDFARSPPKPGMSHPPHSAQVREDLRAYLSSCGVKPQHPRPGRAPSSPSAAAASPAASLAAAPQPSRQEPPWSCPGRRPNRRMKEAQGKKPLKSDAEMWALTRKFSNESRMLSTKLAIVSTEDAFDLKHNHNRTLRKLHPSVMEQSKPAPIRDVREMKARLLGQTEEKAAFINTPMNMIGNMVRTFKRPDPSEAFALSPKSAASPKAGAQSPSGQRRGQKTPGASNFAGLWAELRRDSNAAASQRQALDFAAVGR